jgi:hypothetical protein
MVNGVENGRIMPAWATTGSRPKQAVRPVAAQFVIGALTISFGAKLLRAYGPNRLFIRLTHDCLELLERGGGEEKVISRAVVEASGRLLVGGLPLKCKETEVTLGSSVSFYLLAEQVFPELGPVPEPKIQPRADFFSGTTGESAQLAGRLTATLAGTDIKGLENIFLEDDLFRTSLRPLIRFADEYFKNPSLSADMINKLLILLTAGISLLNSDLAAGSRQRDELAHEIMLLFLGLAKHSQEAVMRPILKERIPRLVAALNQEQLAVFQAYISGART